VRNKTLPCSSSNYIVEVGLAPLHEIGNTFFSMLQNLCFFLATGYPWHDRARGSGSRVAGGRTDSLPGLPVSLPGTA